MSTSILKLSRRDFLSISASFGLMALFGCSTTPPSPGQGVTVYRRSGKGRHVSNAAKKHNANHMYATEQVSALDLVHPGDRSRVVSVTISTAMFTKLFSNGKLVADLRHDL